MPTPCRLCRIYGRKPPNTPTTPHVCDPDRETLATQLERLTALADELPAAVYTTPTRDRGLSARRTRPGPREPINLNALSEIGPGRLDVRGADQIAGPPPRLLLAPWCDELAEWRGETAPTTSIALQATYLRTHLGLLCNQNPHIADLAQLVKRTIVRFARLVDDAGEPDPRHPIGECPTILDTGARCATTLRASTWDTAVGCDHCGTTWPRAQWNKLAAAQNGTPAA